MTFIHLCNYNRTVSVVKRAQQLLIQVGLPPF